MTGQTLGERVILRIWEQFLLTCKLLCLHNMSKNILQKQLPEMQEVVGWWVCLAKKKSNSLRDFVNLFIIVRCVMLAHIEIVVSPQSHQRLEHLAFIV